MIAFWSRWRHAFQKRKFNIYSTSLRIFFILGWTLAAHFSCSKLFVFFHHILVIIVVSFVRSIWNHCYITKNNTFAYFPTNISLLYRCVISSFFNLTLARPTSERFDFLCCLTGKEKLFNQSFCIEFSNFLLLSKKQLRKKIWCHEARFAF